MTQRYTRHPDLRLTELAGEGVVLHLGSRRYFTVNETGLTILNQLKQPSTFTELVDAVCAEFEVDEAVATETTQAFVEHCIQSDVIRTDVIG
jgi:Coenzyme PQQ synthesis protein D (PqqD)